MRVSVVEWILMAAELLLGAVLAWITGWSLVASCALTIAAGIVIQWLYRRGGDDKQKAAWLSECAYTLWRRGGLSPRNSVFWANKLNEKFGDQWSGRQAAEHQISQWQN